MCACVAVSSVCTGCVCACVLCARARTPVGAAQGLGKPGRAVGCAHRRASLCVCALSPPDCGATPGAENAMRHVCAVCANDCYVCACVVGRGGRARVRRPSFSAGRQAAERRCAMAGGRVRRPLARLRALWCARAARAAARRCVAAPPVLLCACVCSLCCACPHVLACAWCLVSCNVPLSAACVRMRSALRCARVHAWRAARPSALGVCVCMCVHRPRARACAAACHPIKCTSATRPSWHLRARRCPW